MQVSPTRKADRISVLCVDDNEHVSEAVHIAVEEHGGFVWKGSLPDATELTGTVERDEPDVIVLDLDMPGRDPFDALEELIDRDFSSRVIIFSGYVRKELIDRALDAGAWGYVSKNDGERALLDAISRVHAGEVVLSNEARAGYDEG